VPERTHRVAVVTTVIAPYRIPVFNALAQDPDIELHVVFLARIHSGREWMVYEDEIRFQQQVLRGCEISAGDRQYLVNVGTRRTLHDLEIETVICGGYSEPALIEAWLYSLTSDRKGILWSESNWQDKPRKKVLEAAKRVVVARFDRWLVPGISARNYLLHLGAYEKDVYVAPNAVDIDYFAEQSMQYRQNADEHKSRKGYPETIILFVGRFVHRKGVQCLLEAYRRIQRPDLGLVLVGDGSQRATYAAFCRQNGVNNVFWEGFRQREELPFYYGIANLFVMPSLSDPWGLVLNEAMACSLPVIAGEAAGAVPDLIVPGQNGLTLNPQDIERMAQALSDMLSDKRQLQKMGRNSYRIIQHYSPKRCAQGFAEAIKGNPNAAGVWSRMDTTDRVSLLEHAHG